jgi:L-threonylcarbamoyladenylate synthase
MTTDPTIKNIVQAGGILAYPTEGVYGLGCDPFNETAVQKIIDLKGRSPNKGFILIASQWSQIQNLITNLDPLLLAPVKASWPGPVTWIFPCHTELPSWIRGTHDSIALRISAHPIVKAICDTIDQPLISTSANFSNEPALCSAEEVRNAFGDRIDLVIEGKIGELKGSTPIRDVLSGKYFRHGAAI